MARQYPLKRTRNIGIMAHIDAGKTTTTERILYYTGVNYKIGEVHDGAATMDYMEQEQERGITITSRRDHVLLASAAGTVQGQSSSASTSSTRPGTSTSRSRSSVRCASSTARSPASTARRAWSPSPRRCGVRPTSYGVPRICFVNKMDKAGADFPRALKTIIDRLGAPAIAVQLPLGSEDQHFKGVIDLVTMKALRFQNDNLGASWDVEDIPAELADEAETRLARSSSRRARRSTTSSRCASSTATPTSRRTRSSRRDPQGHASAQKMVPVLCGSAFKNKGVQQLLDAVVDFLPSPLEVPPM